MNDRENLSVHVPGDYLGTKFAYEGCGSQHVNAPFWIKNDHRISRPRPLLEVKCSMCAILQDDQDRPCAQLQIGEQLYAIVFNTFPIVPNQLLAIPTGDSGPQSHRIELTAPDFLLLATMVGGNWIDELQPYKGRPDLCEQFIKRISPPPLDSSACPEPDPAPPLRRVGYINPSRESGQSSAHVHPCLAMLKEEYIPSVTLEEWEIACDEETGVSYRRVKKMTYCDAALPGFKADDSIPYAIAVEGPDIEAISKGAASLHVKLNAVGVPHNVLCVPDIKKAGRAFIIFVPRKAMLSEIVDQKIAGLELITNILIPGQKASKRLTELDRARAFAEVTFDPQDDKPLAIDRSIRAVFGLPQAGMGVFSVSDGAGLKPVVRENDLPRAPLSIRLAPDSNFPPASEPRSVWLAVTDKGLEYCVYGDAGEASATGSEADLTAHAKDLESLKRKLVTLEPAQAPVFLNDGRVVDLIRRLLALPDPIRAQWTNESFDPSIESLAKRGDPVILVHTTVASVCNSDRRVLGGKKKHQLSASMALGHESGGILIDPGPFHQVAGFYPGAKVAILPHVSCGECYNCRRGRPNICLEGLAHLGFHASGSFADVTGFPLQSVFPVGRNFPMNALPLLEPLSCVHRALDRVVRRLRQEIAKVKSPADHKPEFRILGGGPMGCIFALALEQWFPELEITMVEPLAGRRKAIRDCDIPVSRLLSSSGEANAEGRADPKFIVVATSEFRAYQDAMLTIANGGTIIAFSGVNPEDPAAKSVREVVSRLPSAQMIENDIHRPEYEVPRFPITHETRGSIECSLLGSSGYTFNNVYASANDLRAHYEGHYRRVQNLEVNGFSDEVIQLLDPPELCKTSETCLKAVITANHSKSK